MAQNGSLIGSLGLPSDPYARLYQRHLQRTGVLNNGKLEVVVLRSSLNYSPVRKGAKSDNENPLVDDAEEGNDDDEESKENGKSTEESGDKESVAEKSSRQEDSGPPTTLDARSKRWTIQGYQDLYYEGLAFNEKGKPSCSIQEEPKI
ncbi:hypothetical protein HAX54_010491 [Datura stramonium]|uniref:Uncharacterized protein n=1 Tax=Datura stramonium TaxID=4076 RepID=A0ABS8TI68_DATST|nr:hypothetical protein [Datura stramonium]